MDGIAGQVQASQQPIMGLEGQLVPQPGLDGITMLMRQEFEKGVRAGLLMTVDLPRALAEHHSERTKELRAEIVIQEEDKALARSYEEVTH